jgi:hypothetical protein
VAFSPDQGTSITAEYRTTVYVLSQDAELIKVAVLAANTTVVGMFDWEVSDVTFAQVSGGHLNVSIT